MERKEGFILLIQSVIAIAALSLSIGCGGESNTGPGTQAPVPIYLAKADWVNDTVLYGVHTIIHCDSAVAISIAEGYYLNQQKMKPTIYVGQVTDEIYSGYNFLILNTVETNPGAVRFSNEGIVIPGIVKDALGPACSRSYFIAPNGSYEFTFTKGDSSDIYMVGINDSSITIAPQTEYITHPTHRVYWRYRPNSFALYCGTLAETSYLCDDIVDSLVAHLDLKEFYYPDSGMAAYARTSMGHYYDAPARFFLYHRESDFSDAGRILEKFVKARQSELYGVGIWIVNWQQEKYMSWLMSK